MAEHARLIAIDREIAIEGQDHAERRFLLLERQARLRGGGERASFGCGNLILIPKGVRVGREDFREIDLGTLRIAWARRVDFVRKRRFRRHSGDERGRKQKAETSQQREIHVFTHVEGVTLVARAPMVAVRRTRSICLSEHS